MAKIFAVFPFLDAKAISAGRNFKVLDLREGASPIWYETDPVSEINDMLDTVVSRDYYDIVIIDLRLDLLNVLVDSDHDVVMIKPKRTLDPEFIISRCGHYRESPLSEANQNLFRKNYLKWLEDTVLLEEVFGSITLSCVRDLNKFPGYVNPRISLSKEIDNFRKGYLRREHRETKKQRRLREKKEKKIIIDNAWMSRTRTRINNFIHPVDSSISFLHGLT